MSLSWNKKIILSKPIDSIWRYVWQWIKIWFWSLLLIITTWPIFILLADLIYHPEGGGLFIVFGSREFELFSLSILFAYWFWVAFLSLKYFTKKWQRIL